MPYIIADPCSDFGKLKDSFFDKYSIPWKPTNVEKKNEAAAGEESCNDNVEEVVKLDDNANVNNDEVKDENENPKNDTVAAAAVEESGSEVPFHQSVVLDYHDSEINLHKECSVRLKRIKFEDVDMETVIEEENPEELSTSRVSQDSSSSRGTNSRLYFNQIKVEVAAYAKSHTIKETCEEFGVSRNSVLSWKKLYKNYNYQDEESNIFTGKGNYIYSLEFRSQVGTHSQTHSIAETSRKFGVKKTTVRRWRKWAKDQVDEELDDSVSSSKSLTHISPYPAEFKAKVGFYAQTHDYLSTSSKFGVSKDSVYKWRKMYKEGAFADIHVEESVNDEESQKFNYSMLFKEQVLAHLEDGNTQSDTAKEFGLSRIVVKKIARVRKEAEESSNRILNNIISNIFNTEDIIEIKDCFVQVKKMRLLEEGKDSVDLRKVVMKFYDEGFTREETAKELGVTERYVGDIRRLENKSMMNHSSAPFKLKNPVSRPSASLKDDVLNYIIEGHTVEEAMLEFGAPEHVVRHILGCENKRLVETVMDDLLCDVITTSSANNKETKMAVVDFAKEVSVEAASKRFNIRQSNIETWMQEINPGFLYHLDFKKMVAQYAEDFSAEEASRRWSVHRSTISRWKHLLVDNPVFTSTSVKRKRK